MLSLLPSTLSRKVRTYMLPYMVLGLVSVTILLFLSSPLSSPSLLPSFPLFHPLPSSLPLSSPILSSSLLFSFPPSPPPLPLPYPFLTLSSFLPLPLLLPSPSSSSLLPQLKCFALADGMPLFCIWISRDMDCERARNADLSMSMNRQPVDPYRTDQVCLSVCLSVVTLPKPHQLSLLSVQ